MYVCICLGKASQQPIAEVEYGNIYVHVSVCIFMYVHTCLYQQSTAAAEHCNAYVHMCVYVYIHTQTYIHRTITAEQYIYMYLCMCVIW
jgi:hypothetical protein